MEQQTKTGEKLRELSSKLENLTADLSIVLAAGHGKRIKSTTSKMLHRIWGVPTVTRVVEAASQGLGTRNQIVVVGIKAEDVATSVGKAPNRLFAYQQEQHGTGHAVQVALETVEGGSYKGNIYIFPGDMGLLGSEAIHDFKNAFEESGCDMMVLTGLYKGDSAENYYGRIVRVPDKDVHGKPAGEDAGKVIEIREHKDILALASGDDYVLDYKQRKYSYSRAELIENCEFNSGVFAFKADKLIEYIRKLDTNNAQGELYITDLISIFNADGLAVGAAPAQDDYAVLGFNTKSVLQEMNEYARREVYEKLKNIVLIEDKDDFFVADDVIQQIIKLDAEQAPIDIYMGKGARLGTGAKISRGLHMGQGAHVAGDVDIGSNCQIDDGVVVSGSSSAPTTLGDGVRIAGRSTVVGCSVEAGAVIEHCLLENMMVKCDRSNGVVQPIRYVTPPPKGQDLVQSS